MKNTGNIVLCIIVQLASLFMCATAYGQDYLGYRVEGKDTVYMDELPEAKVYARLPKQKGREWRKYYRLVHNFSKTYPYALIARKLVEEVRGTFKGINMQ